jgi:hypothetical protein
MEFLLLVYKNDATFSSLPDATKKRTSEECDRWGAKLQASGHLRAMSRLHAPQSAATVRKTGERFLVTDGPFAETKEVLAGYVLVDCRDRAEAVDIAKTFPALAIGLSVEVRAQLTGTEERECWQPRA